MKLHRVLLVVVVVVALAVAATAADKFVLTYKPPVGQVETKLMDAQLSSLELGGTPLGVAASATAKLRTTVDAVNADEKTIAMTAEFTDAQAEFNGQPQKQPKLDPVAIKLSCCGEIQEFRNKGEGLDLFGTGGVPLQLIAGIAGIVHLPDTSVAVGDKWNADFEQEFPTVGKVKIKSESELTAMKDGVATIKTTYSTTLPDFKAPNPMQPGAQIDVQGAKLSVEKFSRDFDTKTSSVRKADGTLVIEANVDVQGFAAPVKMAADFHMIDSRFAPKPGELPKPGDKPKGDQAG
jgi:hypothetical protein